MDILLYCPILSNFTLFVKVFVEGVSVQKLDFDMKLSFISNQDTGFLENTLEYLRELHI